MKSAFINVFALNSYFLSCPMIRLEDNEDPDQTARMRRLVWAFAVRICTKTRFRLARPIYLNESTKVVLGNTSKNENELV